MMTRRAFFDVTTNTSRKNNKIVIMVILNFVSLKSITVKLKGRIISALMYLAMKMNWFTQFMYQIKKIEDYMDLLLITNGNNSHFVYIKNFNRFM